MNWLDIGFVAFSVWGYPVSYLELAASLLGLLSVYLAARKNILTWPTGIVNEFGFFCLFFQASLYAGMLLQVLFFVATVYGWYCWKKIDNKKPVTHLNIQTIIWLLVTILLSTGLFNLLVSNLHSLFPGFIPVPASQSILDSLVAVTSVAATFLMAKKKLFAWILWICVDLMSIVLFIRQDLYLVAIEYGIFLFIACYGYFCWRKHCV
jgi:nicotinamide mononucleotide transporter